MTRSDFLHLSMGLVAVGTVPLVAGCSEEGDTGACDSEPDVSIGRNHGHRLEIPLADVADGKRVTYDIRGSASHTHSVVLTADDFERLEGGGEVDATSSVDEGHDHPITIRCA